MKFVQLLSIMLLSDWGPLVQKYIAITTLKRAKSNLQTESK